MHPDLDFDPIERAHLATLQNRLFVLESGRPAERSVREIAAIRWALGELGVPPPPSPQAPVVEYVRPRAT
jgi:hypothetical protein